MDKQTIADLKALGVDDATLKRIAGIEEIRREMGQYQARTQVHADQAKELQVWKAQIQSRCQHWFTTFHPDPSGNGTRTTPVTCVGKKWSRSNQGTRGRR